MRHTKRAIVIAIAIIAVAQVADARARRTRSRGEARAALFERLVNGRATSAEKQRVLTAGRQAIGRIVRRPTRVTKADTAAVALLSPAQRAKLLAETPNSGFTVKYVTFKRGSFMGRPRPGPAQTRKLRLFVKDSGQQRNVLKAVMGPNTMGYMPGSGHSYGLWKGKVLDMWSGSSSGLRHAKTMLPLWMTDAETSRYDAVVKKAITSSYSWGSNRGVLGTMHAEGRPSAWPPRSTRQRSTGNSCTTAFHRVPVGSRLNSHAWIDTLQNKLAGNRGAKRITGSKSLLEYLSGKSESQVTQVFARLGRISGLRGEARKLDKLKAEVLQHIRLVPKFPLDLMHRESIGSLAQYTGDAPGPYGTKVGIRVSRSVRADLDVQFVRSRSRRW